MGRSGMDLEQFNKLMKRCSDSYGVRYVSPTIHPGFRMIVSIVIDTDKESVEFNCTNNPDENYNLNEEVNRFLDGLGGEDNAQ